ncbi:MAG: type 4a pilus biogenesis protein PilO [Fimbriimonadaceae bacterium]
MNLELGDNLKTWTAICAIFAFLTIGIAVANFIIPLPNSKEAEIDGKNSVKQAKAALNASQDELAELEASNPGLWEGQTETVTPQILQAVTVIAKTQGVTLKSFRPQNPVADGDISRSNFVVLVDGSFPKVVAFTKALDSSTSRLGVNQVQIASIDQESDTVNATIGIIAYIRQPEVKKGRDTTATTDTTPTKGDSKKVVPINKEVSNDPAKQSSLPKDSK